MFRRIMLGAGFVAVLLVGYAPANPIVLPDGAYIDEDLTIAIEPDDTGLKAMVTSSFLLYPKNYLVTSILFPVPAGSRNIAVFEITDTGDIPVEWQWNADPWNNYTTILPEEPNLPVIEWFGPWTSYAPFGYRVTYEHDLIDRPDEKVFLYASGVSKLSGTTQFFNVDFNVTLPVGYAVEPRLDYDTIAHNINRYAMTFSINPAAQNFYIYKDTIIHLTLDAARGDCDNDGIPNGEELSYSLSFTPASPIGATRPATSPTDYEGHFNDDAFLDKVQLGFNSVTVMFGSAGGTYMPGQTFVVNEAANVVTCDIDGDGDTDFAVAGRSTATEWYPFITIYLNDGSGNFVIGRTLSAGMYGYNPQVYVNMSVLKLYLFFGTSSDPDYRRVYNIISTPPSDTDINANWIPDSCENLLPGDLDFSGVKDANDAGAFASHWLRPDCTPPGWCSGADGDHNGSVHFLDFALFSAAWALP